MPWMQVVDSCSSPLGAADTQLMQTISLKLADAHKWAPGKPMPAKIWIKLAYMLHGAGIKIVQQASIAQTGFVLTGRHSEVLDDLDILEDCKELSGKDAMQGVNADAVAKVEHASARGTDAQGDVHKVEPRRSHNDRSFFDGTHAKSAGVQSMIQVQYHQYHVMSCCSIMPAVAPCH